MSAGYSALRAACSFIRGQCIREFVLNRYQINRPGGFIVACTHHGHLEPALVSTHTRRHIYWISRIEFFRLRWLRPLLRMGRAIAVNRAGVPVATLRRAIALARAGEVVGIFPEGGVVRGEHRMIRGGQMKRGVCVISMRAGVPVIPVVVLGCEALTQISPWLPAKRGRVWVAYGDPIFPPTPMPIRGRRRVARFAMSEQLQAAYVKLHGELRARANLGDDHPL